MDCRFYNIEIIAPKELKRAARVHTGFNKGERPVSNIALWNVCLEIYLCTLSEETKIPDAFVGAGYSGIPVVQQIELDVLTIQKFLRASLWPDDFSVRLANIIQDLALVVEYHERSEYGSALFLAAIDTGLSLSDMYGVEQNARLNFPIFLSHFYSVYLY